MAKVAFKGKPFKTCGKLPRKGDKAPAFTLAGKGLSEVSLKDFKGKSLVLNIFPSIDTPVCAASARRFNKEASALKGAAVLCVSMDLPFAQGRFCAAEGLENVAMASDFRKGVFGKKYGVRISDGPLAGLLARAVLVIDAKGRVIHSQLVMEITQEPDYEAALSALK